MKKINCIVCSKKIKKKDKDFCCSKCLYLYKIYTQLSLLKISIERLQKDFKEIQENQEKKYFNYHKENKNGNKKSNLNKPIKYKWKK